MTYDRTHNNHKFNRLFSIILVLLLVMTVALTSCSGGPELLDGEPPYEDLPEMEHITTGYSGSSFGNEFGKVTISITWKEQQGYEARCTDAFYLEYTTSEDDIDYYPMVVQNGSDSLDNETYVLKPYQKLKMTVDIDSYYDFDPNGSYRLVKIFDVKHYNGKTKQCKVYFQL